MWTFSLEWGQLLYTRYGKLLAETNEFKDDPALYIKQLNIYN